MSLDTIFRIQSMTKPVVSVADDDAGAGGRIGLDDPVSKYLPEYAHSTVYDNGTIRPAKTVMTIRHLLTHTSGLIAVVGPPRTPLARDLGEVRSVDAGPDGARSLARHRRVAAARPIRERSGTTVARSTCRAR